MTSSKDDNTEGMEIRNGNYTDAIRDNYASFLAEMKLEIEHFGADFKKLRRMILNTVKDPDGQNYLISQAAELTR